MPLSILEELFIVREIHDSFIRRVISSIYFEVTVGNDVIFRIVAEDSLKNDIMLVLAEVYRNGGKFSLRRVERI